MQVKPARIIGVFSMLLAFFLLLAFRLISLTTTDAYQQAATQKSTVLIHGADARGTIYDRNMQPLVNEESEYVGFAVLPQNTEQFVQDMRRVAKSDFESLVELAQKGRPFVFQANFEALMESVFSFRVPVRYSGTAAHLIGYPTSVTETGYTGLEAAYNDVLSENSGELEMRFTVDAVGRQLSGVQPEVFNSLSDAAGGVVLTLDRELQKYVEECMAEVKGAAIVMRTDGDIVTMCSAPTFDQNDIAASLEDENSPLLNRALSAYNVGSVFKIIVTCAALECGISTDFSYDCPGYIDLGSQRIHCHEEEGHGVVNLQQALVGSCNPYFIHLAQEIGREKLLETAKKFLFGQSITLAPGIASKAGILPSEEDLIPPAALANLAIGQGTLLATPLQVAVAVNAVANDGVLVQPRLVIGEVNAQQNLVESTPQDTGERIISQRTSEIVQENMAAVFTLGDLKKYQAAEYQSAGKTSTAQTGILDGDREVLQTWLAGFYPAHDPQYTIIVMVEDGRSGTSSAGPIFKQITDYIASSGLLEN